MRIAAAAFGMAALFVASNPAQAAEPVLVDRVIARFEAAELGGADHPHFIFERELAFEARIEALAEKKRGFTQSGPFDDRHVRAALERHVTEEILRSLPVDPPVTQEDVRRRTVTATLVLEQRVDGRANLLAAAEAEGMEEGDLQAMLQRQARASLYLDRMVAPMLDPSDAELREVLLHEPTPFRGSPFDRVATPLRHWYVGERLVSALASFYQGARARLRIVVVGRE